MPLRNILLACAGLALAGCASTQKSDSLDPNGGSYNQHLSVNVINLPQYPEGLPINQVGFCKSPYAPMAGLVDVRGFKTGDKVECPYTGKIFTVPDFSEYQQ